MQQQEKYVGNCIITSTYCDVEPCLHAVIALSEKGRSATQTFIALIDQIEASKRAYHFGDHWISCSWIFLIQISVRYVLSFLLDFQERYSKVAHNESQLVSISCKLQPSLYTPLLPISFITNHARKVGGKTPISDILLAQPLHGALSSELWSQGNNGASEGFGLISNTPR